MTDKIVNQVSDFFKKHGLFGADKLHLVAFSGGIDSMCLLDVLHKLSKNDGFNLVAAHLNHNWRGEESLKEAENARAYCVERGIVLYTEILPEGLPQTEEAARNQRYDFFNRAATKYEATSILTGHTRTDQVETVLYRIIKGTGISGLQGIPKVRRQKNGVSIYRPLLHGITREDTKQYCADNRIIPNADSSNFNEKYLRNRIRLSLLPELRTYNPAVDEALYRLSEVAAASEAIIRECTTEVRQNVFSGDGTLYTDNFLALSSPVKKLVLTDFLGENDVEYGFDRIEELLEFIHRHARSKTGKRINIGKDLWFFVSSVHIQIITHVKTEKPTIVVPIADEGQFCHTGLGVKLKIEKWKEGVVKSFPKEDSNFIFADLSRIKGLLLLRSRHAGDIIQPFGMKGSMKLKKYLINRNVPEYLRDDIPLLADEKQVLWVSGVGTSEILRVTGVPTHRIVIEQL